MLFGDLFVMKMIFFRERQKIEVYPNQRYSDGLMHGIIEFPALFASAYNEEAGEKREGGLKSHLADEPSRA